MGLLFLDAWGTHATTETFPLISDVRWIGAPNKPLAKTACPPNYVAADGTPPENVPIEHDRQYDPCLVSGLLYRYVFTGK